MLKHWIRLPGVDRGEEAKGLNPGVLQYLKSRKWEKEERRKLRRGGEGRKGMPQRNKAESETQCPPSKKSLESVSLLTI